MNKDRRSRPLGQNSETPAETVLALFSVSRQKMEKSCQAVLPPCMFVSILHRHTATVGGRGSFYYQLETNHSEESFTGIHHFTSTLLTKPFGYFCAMFQRVLGSCGCPFLAAPRATKHPTGCRGAEQRFEPTQRLAGAHPLCKAAKSAFAGQPPRRAGQRPGGCVHLSLQERSCHPSPC